MNSPPDEKQRENRLVQVLLQRREERYFVLERETQAVISPEKHGGSSHYRINEKQREDTAESTS
jgi:hypothetical protein